MNPESCTSCRQPIAVGDAVYLWCGKGFCLECYGEKVRKHDEQVAEEIKRRRQAVGTKP